MKHVFAVLAGSLLFLTCLAAADDVMDDVQFTGSLEHPAISDMIYSPAFDGLPSEARRAVYRRMWLRLP